MDLEANNSFLAFHQLGCFALFVYRLDGELNFDAFALKLLKRLLRSGLLLSERRSCTDDDKEENE